MKKEKVETEVKIRKSIATKQSKRTKKSNTRVSLIYTKLLSIN